MADPVTPAERQRRWRRRQALRARIVRAELPEDVIEELAARGVDVDDPVQIGEAIEDLLFA